MKWEKVFLISLVLRSSALVMAAGRVEALPAVCPRQCTKETVVEDCTENWGRLGALPKVNNVLWYLKSDCGIVDCVDGFCELTAFVSLVGGGCRMVRDCTNDTQCQSGPRELDFEGKCSSYGGAPVCKYRWCPPETSIEQVIAPYVPQDPNDWTPPAVCPNGCKSSTDCIDPEGKYGVIPPIPGGNLEAPIQNSACGYVQCILGSGLCVIHLMETPEQDCGFIDCAGDDKLCESAGPTSLQMPKNEWCNSYLSHNQTRKNNCNYSWCPVAEGTSTTTTTTTTTLTIAPSTTTTILNNFPPTTTTITTNIPPTATTTTTIDSLSAMTTTTNATNMLRTTTMTTAIDIQSTTSAGAITNTSLQSTTTAEVATTICCNDQHDCVADQGKPHLASCGEVKCENNRCVFNAYSNVGECGDEYFIWCSGKDELCTNGPSGSAGRCTHYENQECSYEWCPGPRQMTATTAESVTSAEPGQICCIDPSDCVADQGKPHLGSCGEVKCENNRCIFNAYSDAGECGQEYFVWCEGWNELCVKGPSGSVGRCTHYHNQECSYEWCPGQKRSE